MISKDRFSTYSTYLQNNSWWQQIIDSIGFAMRANFPQIETGLRYLGWFLLIFATTLIKMNSLSRLKKTWGFLILRQEKWKEYLQIWSKKTLAISLISSFSANLHSNTLLSVIREERFQPIVITQEIDFHEIQDTILNWAISLSTKEINSSFQQAGILKSNYSIWIKTTQTLNLILMNPNSILSTTQNDLSFGPSKTLISQSKSQLCIWKKKTTFLLQLQKP